MTDENFSNVVSEARRRVVGLDGRLAVSLNEASAITALSRRTLENYIRAKRLPARKIGRRTVICVRALEQFLRQDQPSPTVEITRANSDR